jgi:hypothetical protein
MKHKQATQHGQQPQREVTADAVVATNVVHMQTSKGSESSTEQAPNPMAVPLAVPKEKSSLIAPTSHQALDLIAVPSGVHSHRSTVLAPTSEQASNPVAALSTNTLFTKFQRQSQGPHRFPSHLLEVEGDYQHQLLLEEYLQIYLPYA